MQTASSADEPIRVLLVEDDEDDYLLTRDLLREKHQRTKFEVKWAPTYEEALEELRTPYSACLVDYRLGAQDGLTFIERAIANGYSGPLILLTGQGGPDVDAAAMKSGAADYLVKSESTSYLLQRAIRHSIERKNAERALRRGEEERRQEYKLRVIGRLAAGVAHDFNNLLAVILSYAELISNSLKPGDPMLADIEEIKGAGARAAALTRQLLAFSCQQVLQPRVIDLNEVFAGIDKMLRRAISGTAPALRGGASMRKDIEFTFIAAPGLSSVLADPAQIEQVLLTLVTNARDAMPHGGKLTVQTSDVVLDEIYAVEHVGVIPGPHVMLTVTDTGTGMDKATQARVFEPFFTTKEVGQGTGLGLATAFGIVLQSEGTITVGTEPGAGTTFTVYLPAVEHVEPRISSSPPPNRLRGAETILLVDDDEHVRVLTRTILRKHGYDVLEAHSGGDALLLSEQHTARIDLLLTDVVMPHMTGPQLAECLLAIRPEIKVLYMSGYTSDEVVRHRAHDATIAFIQKPFTPDVLARKLRDVLGAPAEATEARI